MANAHPVQVYEAAGNARSSGSAFTTGADAAFSCAPVVAHSAKCTVIVTRPKERLVTSMIDDVVNHVGRSHAAFSLAHHAEGIRFEELQPIALPLAAVAALCRGQSLTPRIRVQHLDRLRIGYGCASGLHVDAGLAHCPFRFRPKLSDRLSAVRLADSGR